MFESRSPLSVRRRCTTLVIGAAMTILALPVPALAQHQAKVAKNLAEDIKFRGAYVVNVIYDGPQSEVDRLAATYHVNVTKRLSSGAVFTGVASAFGAMVADGNVASLHEDDVVKGASVAEVTTAATGANQLWA